MSKYKDEIKVKAKNSELKCGKCGSDLKIKKETLVCTNSNCSHKVDISNW